MADSWQNNIVPGNPIDIEIKSVDLIKYPGDRASERISLLPQMVEINIYQSIFKPLMTGTILLADMIGLHNFFPLVGEEFVEIVYDLKNAPNSNIKRLNTSKIKFFVTNTRSISVDDTNKTAAYAIDLYSAEMLENGRTRVQRAFYGRYNDLIKEVLTVDLKSKKYFLGFTAEGEPEKTKGIARVNVPNLRPLETIQWFCQRSVSDISPRKHGFFTFFERFEGFYFTTLEQIIQNSNLNASAPEPVKYYYSPVFNERIFNEQITERNLITSYRINDRFNTYDKLIGGYFENEVMAIDITNFTTRSVRTFLERNYPYSLGYENFNTDKFIEDMQNPDSSNTSRTTRIRYIINQAGTDGFYENPTFFEDKLGNYIRTALSFAQVFVTITVPGDPKMQPGEIVDLDFKGIHGFDSPQDKSDKYISGRYLVTNVKHIIGAGNKHVMVLDLHKDAYMNKVATKSDYNTSGSETFQG